MRLVTFQPAVRGLFKTEAAQLFSKYLGYKPVFCFPADTAEEFLFGSFYSAPACPQCLIAVETDNYKAFDLVKWNQMLSRDDLTVKDIAPLFDDVDPKYAEFVIPESVLGTKDIVYDMPVNAIPQHMISLCLKDETEFREYLEDEKAYIDDVIKDLIDEGPGFDGEYMMLTGVMGYLVYRFIFNEKTNIFDMPAILPIEAERQKGLSTWMLMNTMLGDMYDDEAMFSYENFDLLCYMYSRFLSERARYVLDVYDPEDELKGLCPCMNGKKFKDCHGGLISVRPTHL